MSRNRINKPEASADVFSKNYHQTNEKTTDMGVDVLDGDRGFKVTISIDNLNVRTGPGKEYERTQFILPGDYEIVEEKNGYGKLKNGAGWIMLEFTERI